ncbi:MAG TPA: 1-deoxy-D-xylulose-5-phosphate reductoisomerase [Ruminococcaceae bacterium]|nr:1-deoxy-D-xylulose-5-phosphate reductoisomerase [Oscillospiraceae bacterium]
MEIVLLGSTGSIGTQTIEVCRAHNIRIKGLSAHKNLDLLEKQAREFLPEYVAVSDESNYSEIKRRLSDLNTKILAGSDGLCDLSAVSCDKTVNAVVGMAGLLPTLAAISVGNNVALANKETLVAGGEIVMKAAREKNVEITPIDSEHSAIYQCLLGAGENKVSKIILTASGGPFFGRTRAELENITKEQALRHPNWKMGEKVTIDSATMMNKGLELIEAVWLFGVKPAQIEITVHRQSVLHSAVEFEDGAIIAQLGSADMRIPIQFALTAPNRFPCPAKKLSLTEVGSLTFEKPDKKVFSCLSAAKKAIEMGGNAPCIVNCANEAAVSLFLEEKIGFLQIGEMVNSALSDVEYIHNPALSDILNTRAAAEEYVFSAV